MEQQTEFFFDQYVKKNGKVVEIRRYRGALPPIRTMEQDGIIREIEEYEGPWLDGMSDDTGADWLRLRQGCTIESALREYAQLRAAVEAHYPAPKADCHSPTVLLNGEELCLDSRTFLRVTEKTKIPWIKKKLLRRQCEELRVSLIEDDPSGDYRDLLTDAIYSLKVEEYPGSADDAATYGSIRLKTRSPSEKG